MRNAGLEEAQAGIKNARRNINNLRYADDTTLMAESEEIKSLLMKLKGPQTALSSFREILYIFLLLSLIDYFIFKFFITSWEIDGETVETVSDFILGGSKITADGACSHEMKRCFLLGRKVITSLDSIFKSRDITLPKRSV